jgi:hypothetical protein
MYSELFRVLTEEEDLKIEQKWSAKVSAINCSYTIIFSATSIWVTDWSFLLNYFQKCFGWLLEESIVFKQTNLSSLIVILTSLQ